jgi:Zn-finger nucleic acid-binding protein
MKCPVCLTPDLLMSERQGIEIDYCPQCRGVWLDRGELDKIIERSTGSSVQTESVPIPQSVQRNAYPADYRSGHGDKHMYDNHGHSRKKSIWQELFD